MRVEKIDENNIKGYFTAEDLKSSGATLEDFYSVTLKAKRLIDAMLIYAGEQLHMEIYGAIRVQVQTTNGGGVEVDIGKVAGYHPYDASNMIPFLFGGAEDLTDLPYNDYDAEDEYADLFSDSKDEKVSVVYAFRDIEDIIELTKRVKEHYFAPESRLFHYKNRYYLSFEGMTSAEEVRYDFHSVVVEYGELTKVTLAVLEEYGNTIVDACAIEYIADTFHSSRV